MPEQEWVCRNCGVFLTRVEAEVGCCEDCELFAPVCLDCGMVCRRPLGESLSDWTERDFCPGHWVRKELKAAELIAEVEHVGTRQSADELAARLGYARGASLLRRLGEIGRQDLASRLETQRVPA